MEQKLNPEERELFDIVSTCIKWAITNAEAAAKLRLTTRQVRRLKHKVETDGGQGIIHGNRGKQSNRAIDEKTKEAVIAFVKEEKHQDFGPTFAQEQLVKQRGISLGVETVRTLMISNV